MTFKSIVTKSLICSAIALATVGSASATQIYYGIPPSAWGDLGQALKNLPKAAPGPAGAVSAKPGRAGTNNVGFRLGNFGGCRGFGDHLVPQSPC